MLPTEGQIMKPIAIVVCLVLNWVLGAYHGSLLKKMADETAINGKPTTKVKHGWWAYAYAGFVTLIVWGISEKLNEPFNWWLIAATLCARMTVFNVAMNLNRYDKVSMWYVSPEVKNRTGWLDALRKGKFIDWIHYKIFGNTTKWQTVFYAAATIALTIISML